MAELTLDKMVENIIAIFSIQGMPIKINKAKIATAISDKFDYLNDDVTILPLPKEAPSDIPRIILDGDNYRCKISWEKVEFINSNIELNIESSVKNFIPLVEELYTLLLDLGFVFSQIRFVIQGIINSEPIEFLSYNYFEGKKFSIDGFNTGFLYKKTMDKIMFEKWLKLISEEKTVKYIIDYCSPEYDEQINIEKANKIFNLLFIEFAQDERLLFEYS